MSIADNYKLQSTSPCINAGKVIAGNGGKDFFGNTVSGNYPDIGAHDTQTADPTPVAQNSNTFTANFDTADTSAWTTYGGTWSVDAGKYKLAGIGNGYKSVLSNYSFDNFTYEADITTGSESSVDSGIIFRVSNASVGADSFNGYYAGVRSDGVILGKSNGSSIKVYVDDMNTAKISTTDSTYSSGSIGVRTYRTTASFDNINVALN